MVMTPEASPTCSDFQSGSSGEWADEAGLDTPESTGIATFARADVDVNSNIGWTAYGDIGL